jgi:two-component system sensor histidine kinase AlgZ
MRSLRMLVLLVACNTIGGSIPAVASWLFAGASPQHMLEKAKYGMPYSWCIGTLCFVVVAPITRRIRRLRRIYQVPAFLLMFVGLAMLGSIPATLILVAMGWSRLEFVWDVYQQAVRLAIAITIVLGCVVTAFEIVMHRLDAATIELRNRQLAEERANKLAMEARLTSLESRVQPHFLFNTLNSISALIREDPRAAERTVERLAALLRDSLDMNHTRLVALSREMRIVRDYLEIEKTRYGDRLRYSIDVAGDVGDPEVPPFCLQTLVENSVKHVVAQRREGADLLVAASLAGGQLILEVSDNGPGFDTTSITPGHGLDNLQDRLATLFDGAGRFAILRRDGRSVAMLALPVKPACQEAGPVKKVII